jgi:hypothetical protein
MTATMLTTFDELRLDDLDEPVERPRHDQSEGAECLCLLSAVGRCPTRLRAAPS